MAWFRRHREIVQLRAEVDAAPSLAREHAQVQRQLAEAKRSFEARGSWTPEDFSAYQNRVTALQQREMSLRARGLGESRAISGPWPDADVRVPFSQGGPAHPSQIGSGVDRALTLGPVYAASRLLADGVASLPLRVYKPDPKTGAPQRYTGPSIFHSRPETSLGPMGQGPSISGTLYDWVFAAMTALTLEGNCFGWCTSRDSYGYPLSIEWMPPSEVTVDEGVTNGIPNPAKAEYYWQGRHIPKEDVFHVKAYSVAGRVRGISPLRQFANTVDAGLAQQEYGRTFFEGGAFPSGVMRNSMQEVDSEQAGEIKSQVVGALRRHQPLVIGADWTYEAVSVPPEQAQFVETQQLTATQIAAVFNVPAYLVGGNRGDSMTYSSVEADMISFASMSLRPWLRRLEQSFYGILPGDRYAVFQVDDMIKTDQKTLHEVAAIDRQNGFITADEFRKELDRAPLPGGTGKDELPLQLTSDLGRAGVAVPKAYQDSLIMLQAPPGAAPDVAVPGAGDGSNVVPIRKKGPAQVPAPKGEPVASVDQVAREWAGEDAAPAVIRAHLAAAATEAARHGVRFRSPVDVVLTSNQRDWLLSFCRTIGEPQQKKIAN